MAGVNVKMGVSGVAQFKQGMKESQAAVKTLDQELKLNEAQLKLSGDAQQYMENKAGLLAHKLEEQRNVVRQAGEALKAMQANGVDKSSVAFQNMANQLYKAQTELLNTQAELEGVGEAGEDAQEGVSHMNQSLQRIGTNVSFESVVNGIDKITNGLEAAAKKALELGRKLVQAMLQGGQWADDLQTTADEWEMSPEQVYRMKQTANMIDTSAETIFKARQKLIAGMGSESNKEIMGAFAALGITNLTGTDENIEDVFWKAGEGLMQMEDKVARNEYAMKLYGKSWTELIPIFKAGREEYEAWMKSWDWVGDQQFESLLQIDDESNKVKSSWENIQHTLEAAMAPSMLSIMQTLEGVLHEFNEYLTSEQGQEMLQKLGEAVSGLFSDLTSIDPEKVIEGVIGVFEKIKEGLDWIIEHKDDVVNALKVIAGGFALLKLGSLAANIGRIVSGLKGLGIGSGTPNQMDESQAGRPGGSYGAQAAGGGGLFVGLKNALTGAISKGASALTMYDPTGLTALIPSILEDQTVLFRTLRNGGGIGEAASASWETIKASAGEGLGNFTNYFAQDIQKAVWGVFGVKDAADLQWKISTGSENAQRALFGGDEHQYVITQQDLARSALDLAVKTGEFTPPVERMTTVAGEMNNGASELSSASLEMTGAAQNMMNLPAELQTAVTNAIITGMNSVTIVVDVNEIDRRVGGSIGNQVIAMVR